MSELAVQMDVILKKDLKNYLQYLNGVEESKITIDRFNEIIKKY